MDSIQKGLTEAKLIYSKCLKSLEVISDDIHQKRKHKKSPTSIPNLQERGDGVGADSEDEVSLDQSQLDLDLDCESSLKEVDGILPNNLPESPTSSGEKAETCRPLSGDEGTCISGTSSCVVVVEWIIIERYFAVIPLVRSVIG